jgi:hypothetical protein
MAVSCAGSLTFELLRFAFFLEANEANEADVVLVRECTGIGSAGCQVNCVPSLHLGHYLCHSGCVLTPSCSSRQSARLALDTKFYRHFQNVSRRKSARLRL